jgi:antitoxin ParD1/3/4
MNITLQAEQEQFIQSLVQMGKYQTAEDAIAAALELVKEQNRQRDEMRLSELRQKIAVGTEQIARGQVTDGEEVFARLQEKIRRDFGGEG